MPASFHLSSALALVVDLAKPLLSDRVGEEGERKKYVCTVGDNQMWTVSLIFYEK